MAGQWVFMVVGMAFVPLGVVHGIGVWAASAPTTALVLAVVILLYALVRWWRRRCIMRAFWLQGPSGIATIEWPSDRGKQ